LKNIDGMKIIIDCFLKRINIIWIRCNATKNFERC